MQFQKCPYCGKKTPLNQYCAYCGKLLQDTKLCRKCHASISSNENKCLSCGSEVNNFDSIVEPRAFSRLDWMLTKFKPSILLIFLITTNSILQLAISIIFYFFFPVELNSETNTISELSLLLIIIASNIFMIGLMIKILPFSEKMEIVREKNSTSYFKLFIVLIFAITIIEIFTTIINSILDFIGISSLQKTPYDDFFGDPITIFVFTFLIVSVGPIFEELVYRKYTISLMSDFANSKTLIIIVSALIFAISHTAADIVGGSLRYALLHSFAIIILGIILGIIYNYWGLRGAIFFHSLWNFFSLIAQLLVNNNLISLLDLILLFFVGISIFSSIITIYKIRRQIKRLFHKISVPTLNDSVFILSNFGIICIYIFMLAFVQIFLDQNMISAIILLLFNIGGIIFGIILINKENQTYSR